MSDFDDDVRNDLDANADLPMESEEPDVDMSAFLPEETDNLAGADAAQVITIRTSSGGAHYVAAAEPLKLIDVKIKSNLTFAPGVQVFLNNAMITDETVIPLGSTIVAVGSVKGGAGMRVVVDRTAFGNTIAKVINGKDPSRGSAIFGLPSGTILNVATESINMQGWTQILSIEFIPMDTHNNNKPFIFDNVNKMPDAQWNKLIAEWVGAGAGGHTIWAIEIPDLKPAPLPEPVSGIDPVKVKAAITGIMTILSDLAKLVP